MRHGAAAITEAQFPDRTETGSGWPGSKRYANVTSWANAGIATSAIAHDCNAIFMARFMSIHLRAALESLGTVFVTI